MKVPSEPVCLHGYRYSVYTRIVRVVLMLKAVEYRTVEVDPFSELPGGYLKLQPFGRVPALSHGAFTLFETSAITRYVDQAFEGKALQPREPVAQARMDQVISVIGAYAYWPMVRQVCSHAFFRPFLKEPWSRAEIVAGLEASRQVLRFLNDVAAEGLVLTGHDFTLADCHLAPVMDYFLRAQEGKAALSEQPALQGWWDRVADLHELRATDPFGGEHPGFGSA